MSVSPLKGQGRRKVQSADCSYRMEHIFTDSAFYAYRSPHCRYPQSAALRLLPKSSIYRNDRCICADLELQQDRHQISDQTVTILLFPFLKLLLLAFANWSL